MFPGVPLRYTPDFMLPTAPRASDIYNISEGAGPTSARITHATILQTPASPHRVSLRRASKFPELI
ncbi:MAG TPA: hypothetical protein VMS31_13085 [Pyrinomonadaceae bacterium]|nr:hypothetical protein [Pyrinomonadaceae bacterium]